MIENCAETCKNITFAMKCIDLQYPSLQCMSLSLLFLRT